MTASRTTPTLCVLVIITGPSSMPDSSTQCEPVISPFPFKEKIPAKTLAPRSLPRGRTAVTPVRIGPTPTFRGPSPEMSVVCPTSTPPTSVMALRAPGVPSNGTPRSRARGLRGRADCAHATVARSTSNTDFLIISVSSVSLWWTCFLSLALRLLHDLRLPTREEGSVRSFRLWLLVVLLLPAGLSGQGFQGPDLYKLRSVTDALISPDVSRIAYTVRINAPEGRPYSQLWIYPLTSRNSVQVGGADARGGNAVWAPDGHAIAFHGKIGDGKAGLYVCAADGSAPRFLAEIDGTNSPLQIVGATTAWSPDSKQIAFVSATPGPETKDATGDPIVITRYLYKPEAPEGLSHFNDNRSAER